MGRSGVTFQEVSLAAQELKGKAINVTVDNVRNVLGTGSKTTISKHLKAWKEDNGVSHPSEAALPQELLALTKGLWERCQAKADEQINQHAQESKTTIEKAEEKQRSVESNLKATQKNLAKSETQIQNLCQEKKSLEQALAVEQSERQRTESALKHQDKQINREQSENARLHTLLHHMQKNLEDYQTSVQRAREKQQLETEKLRAASEQKLKELRDFLSAESSKYALCKANLNQISGELQSVNKENKSLSEELSERVKQLSISSATNKQYEKTIETKIKRLDLLENQNSSLTAKMAISQAELNQSEKQRTKMERKDTLLTKEVNTLRDKITELIDEKILLDK